MQLESQFLIYKFLIALVIAISALVSIIFGFRLITKGKAAPGQQNTIELLGFKAKVSSLGALMIVTGIGLALVAKSVLPNKLSTDSDGNVEIASLETQLRNANANFKAKNSELLEKQREFESLQAKLIADQSDLAIANQELAAAKLRISEADTQIVAMKEKFDEIASLSQDRAQLISMNEEFRQKLLEMNSALEEKDLKLEASDAALANLTEKLKRLEAQIREKKK